MNLCELIRANYHHDREYCYYPYRYHDGLCQIMSLAYNKAITIDLRFFDNNYEFQVWGNTETGEIIYQPSNTKKDCFIMYDFIHELFKHNEEAALIMVYSIFFKAKRLINADAIAVYAAAIVAAAAYVYAAAAATAHVATAAAHAAAVYAADVDAVYADAASTATAAAHAAYVVYTDAVTYDDAHARRKINNALKYLFRFRKLLLKEGEK